MLYTHQESSLPDCKRLYVLKKENVPVLSENYRSILLFGMLSPFLLLQLSTSVDKVKDSYKEILLMSKAGSRVQGLILRSGDICLDVLPVCVWILMIPSVSQKRVSRWIS